ncbi:MAG: MFS transporter [Proteobacteria bacterium]|nr:MFS transporter [Pseudomonadota bacterium]
MTRSRRGRWIALGLMGYWGYLSGVNGAVAPFLADTFGLADAEISRLLGWIGFASLGALVLGSAADRLGRRRVVLACFAALPLAAVASARAPTPWAYGLAQLAVYALGMTLLSAVVVMLSEASDDRRRAALQGHGGVVFTLGTVLPLGLTILCFGEPGAWRGTWWVAAAPLLLWPLARAFLPETPLWQAARRRGETGLGRLRDLFAAPYRARAVGVLSTLALVGGLEAATRSWLVYHPVRGLGLVGSDALVVLVSGGAVSLAGFWLGGRLCERWGRRGTFAVSACACAAGAWGYYGLSTAATSPLPVLFASLVLLGLGGNAGTVAMRLLATELFPTRMRGLLGGWMSACTAAGWVLAMFSTSVLAEWTGSLGWAVCGFVGLSLPVLLVAIACLPETAGLSLDVASLDRPPAPEPGTRPAESEIQPGPPERAAERSPVPNRPPATGTCL